MGKPGPGRPPGEMFHPTRPALRSRRTRARRAVVIAALERGHTRAAAAALAGMHRVTLWEWTTADPDMAEACDMAEARAEASIVDTLIEQAHGKDFRATLAWLQHRRRTDWKPPTITQEVSGPDGGPIELADVRNKVASILDQYAAEGDQAGVPGQPDPQ